MASPASRATVAVAVASADSDCMNPSLLPLLPKRGTKNIVFNNPDHAVVQGLRGHASHRVVRQGDRLLYLDMAGRRLGFIDHLGKTWSNSNHLLAPNPRPELLICR
jgi:hypothetical protein